MLANRTYLQIETLLSAGTMVTLALLFAVTAYIISTVVIDVIYLMTVTLALLCLLVSLAIGCYGLVKSLMLLGCEQWNVRMIHCGFIAQGIFICVGLLFYLVSLFFIR
jgi:hypothetical protein